jgi:hypothetical protein
VIVFKAGRSAPPGEGGQMRSLVRASDSSGIPFALPGSSPRPGYRVTEGARNQLAGSLRRKAARNDSLNSGPLLGAKNLP